jgi:hypothetical protein
MSGLNTTELTWAKINKMSYKKTSQYSSLQKLLELTSDAKQEIIQKAWAGCSRHVKSPEKLYWQNAIGEIIINLNYDGYCDDGSASLNSPSSIAGSARMLYRVRKSLEMMCPSDSHDKPNHGLRLPYPLLSQQQRWLSVPYVSKHHTSKGCRQERNTNNNTHPT